MLAMAAAGFILGAAVGVSMLTPRLSTDANGPGIAPVRETPRTSASAPTSVESPVVPSPVLATPEPTPSPTPSIPGRGAMVEGQGLSIQLVDYEIRPDDHPERAAARYVLKFTNLSRSAAQVEFNLSEIAAVDNIGNAYKDYYVVSNTYMDQRCVRRPGVGRFVVEQRIQIPAESSKQFDFFLNRAGAEGNCASRGEGTSRVDPAAIFVDLQFPPVKYRTDGPAELPSSIWRLSR